MKIQARNVQTNISSVIGNATSFYIEYLKRLFPPGFFKDSFISGTLPSIEREAKDFINRAKPTLIVRPEYNAESGIMGELPIWHNAYQYVFKNSKSYYNTILSDPVNGNYIYGIPDRIKINMNTKIVMPTKIYSINVLHHLKNTIEPGGVFYLDNKSFENELPTSYVRLLIDLLEKKENRKFDENNEEDLEYIENYFNRYSLNGCILRRNLSTGNKEFAFRYNSNVLLGMESLPTVDVSRRSKSEDLAIVSFEITFEFTTNSNFILEIPDNTKIDDLYGEGFDSEGRYTFNIALPVEFAPEMDGDFRLYKKQKFIAEANIPIDVIEFGSLLNSGIIDFIKPYINKNGDFKDIEPAKIEIYMNGLKLGKSDFHVDWNLMKLYMYHPIGNKTYGFAFYLNQLEYNKQDMNKIIIDKTKSEEI